MKDKDFIVICAIVSIMFVYVLDNAFIISTQPAKHLVEFTVNNTKITVPFDCDPQYFLNNTTLVCTNGDMIRP